MPRDSFFSTSYRSGKAKTESTMASMPHPKTHALPISKAGASRLAASRPKTPYPPASQTPPNATWLDIFPGKSDSKSKTPRPVPFDSRAGSQFSIRNYSNDSSSSKTQEPSISEMIARIEELRAHMPSLLESAEIREFICKTHSHEIAAARGGPTWKRFALSNNRVIYALDKETQDCLAAGGKLFDGKLVTEAKVAEWEKKIAELVKTTENHSDYWVGPEERWLQGRPDAAWVFKSGWNFPGAEGKGPGLDDVVDPRDASKAAVNPAWKERRGLEKFAKRSTGESEERPWWKK